ncbi:MAG: ABC transporter [Rhodobacterales bacterium]|nr:MAG: ABC transporter [Rhodobacterales bacterium]
MKIFTPTKPTRRNVTFGLVSALALGGFAQPAAAVSNKAAAGLVTNVVNDINRVIASGKSEARMIVDFEKIFVRYSDVRYLASYALGVDGRRASAAQKRGFQKAFQGYIARKYGKQFRTFIGGRLEIERTKTVKKHVEVRAMAHLRGQAPFDVTFFVSDKSGKPLFYNMYIEGINMLLTERSEIGAMLDKRRGNIDRLIKDLRKVG